jgi:hypothetical protein
MPDGELRQHLTKVVYRNLADRGFRDLLTATAPEGSRPLIVALAGDSMHEVMGKLHAAGNAGNVVVPKANGFLVIAMTADGADQPVQREDEKPAELTSGCTMGVFAARLLGDGGEGYYRFRTPRSESGRESGQAKLVALGR